MGNYHFKETCKDGVIAKMLVVRHCELQNKKGSTRGQKENRSKLGDLVFAMVREEQASWHLTDGLWCVWHFPRCFTSNLLPLLLLAKSLQSYPTLGNPIDGSPPGSAVPGILQARTLEWVAISFSNAGKWKVKVKSLSHVWLSATPWTAAYQAPPSMRFSQWANEGQREIFFL